MEEHVVTAHASPRRLFSTAKKVWGWAPLYSLALVLLVVGVTILFISLFPVYATPLVTIRSALALSKNEYGDTVVAAETCETLFPRNGNTSSDLVERLTSTMTGLLSADGQLDANLLRQGAPYEFVSCVDIYHNNPVCSDFSPFTPTQCPLVWVATVTLRSRSLPEMFHWDIKLGWQVSVVHWDMVDSWLIADHTIKYRYRAQAMSAQLVQLGDPSATHSTATGLSSYAVSRGELSHYVIVKLIPLASLSCALLMFVVVFAEVVIQYRKGRREAASLQALVDGRHERVVGHIRAPPGAQVPRARVRGEFVAEESGDNSEATAPDHRAGADVSADVDVEFPYGHAVYVSVGDSERDPAAATAEGAQQQQQQQPSVSKPTRDAAEVPSRDVPAAAASAKAHEDETATGAAQWAGIPLASVSAQGGTTTSTAVTTDLGATLIRDQAQYRGAVSALLYKTVVVILVGVVMLLCVSVFHLCATLEHWRTLYVSSWGSLGAAVESNPTVSAAVMNWVSLALMCCALGLVWCIHAHEYF